MYFLCCQLLFTLFSFHYAWAALQNVTIDDTNNGGQITYKPDGYWNGPGCSGCDAHPDPSQAFEGTWSDTTCVPGSVIETAELSFTGSAIYIYGILGHGPNFSSTDLSFFIDNQQVGVYQQPITDETGFDYNVLLFSTQSMSNSQHTLTIQNGHQGGTQMSLILLDRIAYSLDDGSSAGTTSSQSQPSSSPNNPGNAGSSQTTSSASSSSQSSSPSGSPTESSFSSSSHNAGSSLSGTTSPPSQTNFPSSPNGTNSSGSFAGSSATTLATGSHNSDSSSATLDSSTSKSSHKSTIIGVVVGVVVMIILILVLLCFFIRRRRQREWLLASSGSSENVNRPRWASVVPAALTSAATGSAKGAMSDVSSLNSNRALPPTAASFITRGRHQQDTSVDAVPIPARGDATHEDTQTRSPQEVPISVYSDSYEDTMSTSHASSNGGPRFQPKQNPSESSHQNQMVELETAVLLAAENQRLRDENQRLRDEQGFAALEEEMPPPYLQAR